MQVTRRGLPRSQDRALEGHEAGAYASGLSTVGDSCGNDGDVGSVQRGLRSAINPWSTRATMLLQTASMRRALRSRSWPSPLPTDRGPRPKPAPTAVAFTGPTVLRRPGSINRPHVAVPDVVGLQWDEALAVLRGVQLFASRADGPAGAGGVVTAQHPDAQSTVPRGSSITLRVRRGPGSAGVREPRRPRPGPLSAHEALTEPSEEERSK
jgi:PASTA domain